MQRWEALRSLPLFADHDLHDCCPGLTISQRGDHVRKLWESQSCAPVTCGKPWHIGVCLKSILASQTQSEHLRRVEQVNIGRDLGSLTIEYNDGALRWKRLLWSNRQTARKGKRSTKLRMVSFQKSHNCPRVSQNGKTFHSGNGTECDILWRVRRLAGVPDLFGNRCLVSRRVRDIH